MKKLLPHEFFNKIVRISKPFLILVFICFAHNVSAQSCLEANPFCSQEGLIFENESGTTVADPSIDYDCLLQQPDPSWFFLKIDQPGQLDFTIIQNTMFDANGNPTGSALDVDFIAWGPFNSVAEGCDDLNSGTQIGCSYSAAAVENFTISNAMEDEIYILLITNFSQDPGFISLQQDNFGDPGAGSTDCDIVFDCTVSIDGGNQTFCGVDDTTLTTSTTGPIDSYQWFRNDVLLDGETNSTLFINENGDYKVVANGSECDSAVESTVTIIFEGFDITTNLPAELDVCSAFEPLDATPTNPGIDLSTTTYSWKDLTGNEVSTEATYTPTSVGLFNVTVTSPPCSEDTFTIDVQAFTNIDVTVDADFKTCPNEPNTLTATTSTENASFQWSLNGTAITGATDATLNVMVAPEATGTQVYSVVVTAGLCSGTDEVNIELYDIANCIISEGLSPNGSPGFNDSLDLEFLADRSGIAKVQIFNRLGTSVYEETSYINQWRGQTNEGDDLPTGTYFYVIDFEAEDPLYGQQATGWIYLNQDAK